MRKTKLLVVTGFLGSGKTSFLKFLLEKYSDNQKIAVIQNEFSGLNIDAVELKNTKWKFELVEINNGSVFCVCQFSNFREQLSLLHNDYNPDLVVLEATGLADPLAIGTIFNNNPEYFLYKIVTIVDAHNYMVASKAVMAVNNQIRVADVILINKCDLVIDSEIDVIKSKLNELNPSALIVESNYSEYRDFNLDEESESAIKSDGELSQPNPDIVSEVYRESRAFTVEELEGFIKNLPSQLIRMKGFIKLEGGRSCSVQFVSGQLDVKMNDNPVSRTELIKISYR